MIVGITVFATAAFAERPPEPRSLSAKCNREVGGHYNWTMRSWVISRRQIMAKNACIDRMTNNGKKR